jgi:hypothetical protein
MKELVHDSGAVLLGIPSQSAGDCVALTPRECRHPTLHCGDAIRIRSADVSGQHGFPTNFLHFA